jgi:hypothetical protein
MVFWESWLGVSSVLSFGYSSDALILLRMGLVGV